MTLVLYTAAAVQVAVSVLNLFLVKLLHWETELQRAPLLLREVFQVHAWFISITLAIFGALTWRFASEFAHHDNPLACWLAAGIALFWSVRLVLQVFYYSSSHWRGQRGRALVHIALLLLYGGLACVYFWAAFGGCYIEVWP